MANVDRTIRKPKVFYGWWIVLASTVSGAMRGGLVFYAFGTYFTPLITEFGWSRVALSGVASLARLEGSLLAPVEGYFVDRLGPRKIMLFGFVLCGIGFILLSQVNSLTMFYIIFILLVTTGSAIFSFIPPQTAIANWFIRKRARAFGILATGWGLGGVMLPMLAWLIAQYGWRTAFQVSGIIMLVLGIPIALIMRHKPEQYGYLPDGEARQEPETGQQASVARAAPAEVDFTVRQTLKTTAFWLMAFAFMFSLMSTDTIGVHLVPHLEDAGVSPQLAATIMGTMALISIPARLGFGWLGDVWDKRYAMVISYVLQGIGLFILANITSTWQIFLFLAIFSPGYGGRQPLMSAMRGEYFGRKTFGTIAGFMQIITMLGSIAGPLIAGWVFDATGSYRLIFTLLGVASLIGIVLLLMIRRPVLAPESAHQSGAILKPPSTPS